MLLQLGVVACFAVACLAETNSVGGAFSETLSSSELSVDLGLQLDATVKPHQVDEQGVASVSLASSDGPAGLGPQLSATVKRSSADRVPPLGLGPQLGARITPGKPKNSLRALSEKDDTSSYLPGLLRFIFCVAGLFVVFLSLTQQEAEQGRQSRIKNLLHALKWNRNK
eukprot:gb/GFBE01079695.1/.p1 GENE.gb/GFBE01079695.1/~~gb/GFBE01079695.1/.p1  ORF type:complete len:169 (+),score=36.08 gb/GFBE01079695.1/:1-507(+)